MVKKGVWNYLTGGALKRIAKRPKDAFFLVLFDILLLVSLYAVATFASTVIPSFRQWPVPENMLVAIAGIISIGYIFVLLIVYSFFKFMILQLMHDMDGSLKRIKGGFWDFLKLNVLVAFLVGIIIFLLDSVFVVLKQETWPVYAVIVVVLVSFTLYIGLLIIHSRFTTSSKIVPLVTKGVTSVFSKFTTYIHLFILPAIILVLYYIIYYLVASSMLKSGVDVFTIQQQLIPILTITTGIVLYVLHFFLRLSFFEKFSR